MKILVVDKHPEICFLYREELVELGHRVIFTNNSVGLFEAIEMYRPAALILGTRLPDIEGSDSYSLDLLVRIKVRFPELAVIYNSGIGEFRTKAISLGADFCAQKSSDVNDIKQAVLTISQKKSAVQRSGEEIY